MQEEGRYAREEKRKRKRQNESFEQGQYPTPQPELYSTRLARIILDEKVLAFLGEQKATEVQAYLHKLTETEELFHQQHALAREDQALIEMLESSHFFQAAKEIVEAIKPSVAYTINIEFDDNKLRAGARIKIRHYGNQSRHITPVMIVEKILKLAFSPGYQIDIVYKLLLNNIELFKDNSGEKDNHYIQAIFDYYSNKLKINPTREEVISLTKIVAHLYNKGSINVVSGGKKNVPHTNELYLVPNILKKTDHLFIHRGEGSFIKALGKVLDNICGELQKKGELTSLQLKQASYIIFAMFDFLPQQNDDSNKHMGQLYEVAAKHILLVFEAYPILGDQYKSIIKQFITYVIIGISQRELLRIIGATGIRQLSSLFKQLELIGPIERQKKLFNEKYTCEDGGQVSGFIELLKQSGGNENEILLEAEAKITAYIEKKFPAYRNSSKLILSDTEYCSSNQIKEKIENVASDLITIKFINNLDFNVKTDYLNHLVIKFRAAFTSDLNQLKAEVTATDVSTKPGTDFDEGSALTNKVLTACHPGNDTIQAFQDTFTMLSQNLRSVSTQLTAQSLASAFTTLRTEILDTLQQQELVELLQELSKELKRLKQQIRSKPNPNKEGECEQQIDSDASDASFDPADVSSMFSGSIWSPRTHRAFFSTDSAKMLSPEASPIAKRTTTFHSPATSSRASTFSFFRSSNPEAPSEIQAEKIIAPEVGSTEGEQAVSSPPPSPLSREEKETDRSPIAAPNSPEAKERRREKGTRNKPEPKFI